MVRTCIQLDYWGESCKAYCAVSVIPCKAEGTQLMLPDIPGWIKDIAELELMGKITWSHIVWQEMVTEEGEDQSGSSENLHGNT